jgi:hypothetical protein
MSRKKADPGAVEVTQEEPTRPRPVDANGRQLDRFGLPLSGPARAAALAGKPDPALAEDEPADAAADDAGVSAGAGE